MTGDDTVGGLHVRVDGARDAPAVVLLNSLGCDLDMWSGQLADLAQHLFVVRFDARGHGRSSVPHGPATIADLASDVMSVMDWAGVPRAHVVGVSMGGLVALELAVRHPERVDRLVVGNTAARIGTADVWRDRAATVRAAGMAAVADTVLARFFTDDFRRRCPQVTQRFREMLLATDPQRYAACCDVLQAADLRGDVGRIRAETLVVAGAEDVATPVQLSHELVAAIPRAQLLVLDDASHLSSVERPEAFGSAVMAFLRA